MAVQFLPLYVDRSLAVAGIAVASDESSGQLNYIHSGKAVALLPNLAIHLNREVNNTLSYNAQTQLKAVFGRHSEKQDNMAAQFLRQKLGLGNNEVCELQLCSGQKPELIGLDDMSNGASYSSDPFSIAHIRAIAQEADCHLQSVVSRSDKPTGSTIGPILSSQLGVRSVDIGLPMYAMHSLQETVSLHDYLDLQKLVHEYYR